MSQSTPPPFEQSQPEEEVHEQLAQDPDLARALEEAALADMDSATRIAALEKELAETKRRLAAAEKRLTETEHTEEVYGLLVQGLQQVKPATTSTDEKRKAEKVAKFEQLLDEKYTSNFDRVELLDVLTRVHRDHLNALKLCDAKNMQTDIDRVLARTHFDEFYDAWSESLPKAVYDDYLKKLAPRPEPSSSSSSSSSVASSSSSSSAQPHEEEDDEMSGTLVPRFTRERSYSPEDSKEARRRGDRREDSPSQRHSEEAQYDLRGSMFLPETERPPPASAKVKSIVPLFACQKPSDVVVSHNERLAAELERNGRLTAMMTHVGHEWQARGNRIAAAALRRYPKPIRNLRDLADMPKLVGVGDKTIKKIRQFLVNGISDERRSLERNEAVQIKLGLSKVFGVGTKEAEDLYRQGVRSVEDMRKHPELLSAVQKRALPYYEDLQKRIPREEVHVIARVVEHVGNTVLKGIRLDLTGSYRRGAKTCGDVDILITHERGSELGKFTTALCKHLASLKPPFLVQDLLVPRSEHADRAHWTYTGICRLAPEHLRMIGDEEQPVISGLYRHIDIRVLGAEYHPFALLAFTGNDVFNRSMRTLAHKFQLSLSEHGIVPAVRRGKETIARGSRSYVCKTEEEIFTLLEMKYVPPEKRNQAAPNPQDYGMKTATDEEDDGYETP